MTVNMGLECFVPIISQWQLQSENDIYDTINDWGFHEYLCIMNDGKEIKANGIADEGYDGSCSTYINFNDGDYSVDDIMYWCEVPQSPGSNIMDVYGKTKAKEAINDYREQFLKEFSK